MTIRRRGPDQRKADEEIDSMIAQIPAEFRGDFVEIQAGKGDGIGLSRILQRFSKTAFSMQKSAVLAAACARKTVGWSMN
jgi:DNA-nicking Smr family endonuclease